MALIFWFKHAEDIDGLREDKRNALISREDARSPYSNDVIRKLQIRRNHPHHLILHQTHVRALFSCYCICCVLPHSRATLIAPCATACAAQPGGDARSDSAEAERRKATQVIIKLFRDTLDTRSPRSITRSEGNSGYETCVCTHASRPQKRRCITT